MSENCELQTIDICIQNCEICPHREKKEEQNQTLFPEYFRSAAKASNLDEAADCRHMKVDLSNMFGRQGGSGNEVAIPTIRKVSKKQT